MPTQVDLSMLFPESGDAEEHSLMPAPVFLSGEKRQAIYTTAYIRPEKKVDNVNKELNQTVLNNYLYVTCSLCNVMILTLSRSKYYIELSQDLDDAAVSLLIENGLKKRFPAACDTWKFRTSESRETSKKCVVEGKHRVEEELNHGKSVLEDILGREVARRISEAYPCVFLSWFHL